MKFETLKPIKKEAVLHKEAPKEAKEAKKSEEHSKKMAVILVRGLINTHRWIRETLIMLNLKRANNCVVINANKSNMGMIKKVKDFVTYGEIDEPTMKLLQEKRKSQRHHDKRPYCKGSLRALASYSQDSEHNSMISMMIKKR